MSLVSAVYMNMCVEADNQSRRGGEARERCFSVVGAVAHKAGDQTCCEACPAAGVCLGAKGGMNLFQ